MNQVNDMSQSIFLETLNYYVKLVFMSMKEEIHKEL